MLVRQPIFADASIQGQLGPRAGRADHRRMYGVRDPSRDRQGALGAEGGTLPDGRGSDSVDTPGDLVLRSVQPRSLVYWHRCDAQQCRDGEKNS